MRQTIKKRPMRKLLSFAILSLVAATLTAQTQTFDWQGSQRQYIVREPAGRDASQPIPVMFFLHGLGDNAANCDGGFGFSSLANRYGWLIVTPQATTLSMMGYSMTMWNAGLGLNTTADDSGFLMALLDSLTVTYNIDRDSVFFTGFSMGGFMTHRMAIEHGDQINACAPVSGLITTSMARQTPVAAVKLLHIHGDADQTVGYDGSSRDFGMNLGIAVDSSMRYWIKANQSNSEPIFDNFPDSRNDGLRFERYSYHGGQRPLQHIKVIGGVHEWYSTPTNDIDYFEVIHQFFVSDEMPTVGIEEAQAADSRVKLYPNPSNGRVTIETARPESVTVCDIKGNRLESHNLAEGANTLDLGNLEGGLYILKFADGSVKRLVIR